MLLNIVWLIAGVPLCLVYALYGVIWCATVVGIPFGVQSLKLAGYALWPFGRMVVDMPNRSRSLSVIGNLVWMIFAGVPLAILHAVLGALLCVTVVGIPLGLGNFKLIPLAFRPFGKDIVKRGQPVGGVVMVSF